MYNKSKKDVTVMAEVLVNFKMDEDLKKSMEQTEVSVDPFYSDRNIAAIDEAAMQIERGQVIIKTIEELEDMENG